MDLVLVGCTVMLAGKVTSKWQQAKLPARPAQGSLDGLTALAVRSPHRHVNIRQQKP